MLWGSAVWAMAAAVGQSFAELGNSLPLCGTRLRRCPRRSTVVIRQAGGDDEKGSPLEVDLEDRRAFQLAQAGFAPLVAQLGPTGLFSTLLEPSTNRRVTKTKMRPGKAILPATLPYRLFAGAVAHELDRAGPHDRWRRCAGGDGRDRSPIVTCRHCSPRRGGPGARSSGGRSRAEFG